MADKVTMKQGNLLPRLTATLQIGNPLQPVDLTGCTIKLRYFMERRGLLIERDAVIVGMPTDGNVAYDWVSGDTDTPGIYEAEWRVQVPPGKPLTIPNGSSFLLMVVPSVGAHEWNATLIDNQTNRLLRRLRVRLADAERALYTDDSDLVQALFDTFEDMVSELALTNITLFLPTDVGFDANNPLNTTGTGAVLERWQQDVWMLLTAREILEAEIVSAARIAGTLSSPAGHMSLKGVADSLREALQDIEADLETKRSRGNVPFNFVNLGLSDAVRFLQD